MRLTPSDLGHRFVEHLVQQCFEKAGHADAEKLKNLLMAAAIIDQTELRLDKPPAVEDQFQIARLALLNVLEFAIDVNKTGPVKDAVVAAVNELCVRSSPRSSRTSRP